MSQHQYDEDIAAAKIPLSDHKTHSRRGFLQLGLVASTGLALASNLAKASNTLSSSETSLQSISTNRQYHFLDANAVAFFSAVIPVVLDNKTLEKHTLNEMIDALDNLIHHFNGFNQLQLKQLFDAMAFAPVRFVAGAPWQDWPDTSTDEVQAFLVNWRDSRFALKRMGYLSICKLINLCWYARKETYTKLGYPGPPTHIPTPISL